MASDILTLTFIRLRSRLKATASRLLNDDSAADDVLQDAFYRLWRHRDDITSDSQAEGMSVVAVRNTCIDALRNRQRQNAVPIDQVDSETAVTDNDNRERRELYEDVKAIIDRRLTERERCVITMRDIDGMDYADIADMLGITETNARAILSRARRAVREIYLSSNRQSKQS